MGGIGLAGLGENVCVVSLVAVVGDGLVVGRRGRLAGGLGCWLVSVILDSGDRLVLVAPVSLLVTGEPDNLLIGR